MKRDLRTFEGTLNYPLMTWVERMNALTGYLDFGEGNGAEILRWSYQANLPDNAPHRHTYFEICLVGDWGSGQFRVEDAPYSIQSHQIFYARPGVIHQIVNTSAPLMELYWVCFSLQIGSGEVGELLRAFRASNMLVARDSATLSLWKALRLAAEEAPLAGSGPQLQFLSQALLLSIARSGASENLDVRAEMGTPRDRRASQARLAVQYVQDNLGQPLSLAEIANHLHVSTRHLSRLFVDFTGTSVASYIETTRVDRAVQMLLRSDKPLKEISSELGFEDASHFNRVFRRVTGTPPGEFRRGQRRVTTSAGSNIQKIGKLV